MGFLVSAVRRDTGERGEGVMDEIVQATGTLRIADCANMAVSVDTCTPATMTTETTHEGVGDGDIQRLWNEMYNSYYWYSYQRYVQRGRGVQGEGEREGEGEGDAVFTAEQVMWC